MILVDTSVIVSFWKMPTEPVKDVFVNNDVFISGVSIAELLFGAKNEMDFQKILNALSVFREVFISEKIWIQLGNNLYILKKKGITVPFQDALIATIAMEENLSVWAYDKHYAMIQNVLPDLKLFDQA